MTLVATSRPVLIDDEIDGNHNLLVHHLPRYDGQVDVNGLEVTIPINTP